MFHGLRDQIMSVEVVKKNGAYDDVYYSRYLTNYYIFRKEFLSLSPYAIDNRHMIDFSIILLFFNLRDFVFSFLHLNYDLNGLLFFLIGKFLPIQLNYFIDDYCFFKSYNEKY